MKDNEQLISSLQEKLIKFSTPGRKAISSRFPRLGKPILWTKRAIRRIQYFFHFKLTTKIYFFFLKDVIARHQSLLHKKLGESDPKLQKQKITNLQKAAEKLNGLIIQPGESFSFWHTVGKPTKKKGYVEGMLLSDGKVQAGIGGGMCQMSNLLYWMFLHAPVKITERYHHSRDVFPDSGRVLPFGSGATIFYNYVDLRIKNTSDQPIQIKVWITDRHLKGQILSSERLNYKYHIAERNHCFVNYNEKYFRYNELWREKKVEGQVVSEEKIVTNFAPVLYEVTEEYLEVRDYKELKFAPVMEI